MIDERFGRYRIVAPIASGGMSEVWKAHDELRGSAVALKLLAPHLLGSVTERKRFLAEARTTMSLSHPGIVAVHEVGERGDQPWMAMSYIEGESLGDRIGRAPLFIPEALSIVAQVAEALGFAHEHQVIHRDVKTSNILLARDSRAILIDFGVAIVLGGDRLTTTGKVIGTIACLSPEVIRGERADERSDIYGLGIVLYESITGMLPYRGETSNVVLYAVAHEPLVPPSAWREDIPKDVEQLIVECLARSPEERPHDMHDLVNRLRSLVGSLPHETDHLSPRVLTPTIGARPVPRVLLGLIPFEVADEVSLATQSFARGIAEMLATDMSQTPGLTVISPQRQTDTGGDLPVLARRIGANRILGGRVQEVAGIARVHWWIVDPFTGVRIAGGREDADARNLFQLEDRLASSVLEVLNLEGTAPTRITKDPAARERLTQAAGYLRRHDDPAAVDAAIAILERLLKTEGPSSRVLALVARAYLLKHVLTQDRIWESRAAEACEKARELEPQAPDVLLMLGELRLAAGNADAALECFQTSMAALESPETLMGLGKAYEALRRPDLAETAFLRAIAVQPEWWATHDALGRFYSRRGKFEEAIAAWRDVLALTPDNPRAYSHLALAYFRLGRIEEAAEACERAVATRPEGRSFSNWGTALFYLGRYDESAEAYERAVALEPSDAFAWANLGGAYRLIPGRELQASTALEKAVLLMRDRVARNPGEAEVWSRLAGCLINLTRREESIDAIERALELAPDHVEILTTAVGVYQSIDPARAVAHLTRAVGLGYSMSRFTMDPALEPLRATPEFRSAFGHSPDTRGSRV